jgi:hypothetical protein
MTRVLVFLFFLSVTCTTFADRITKENIKDNPNDPNERCCEKEINIGGSIKLKATISITSHGNGWMKVANLNLYVYGGAHSVAVYEPMLMDIDFVDIDGDGFKDLVISGNVLYYDNETLLRREPVVFIYMFNSQRKEFYCAYRKASYSLDRIPYDDIENIDLIDKHIKDGQKKAQEENEEISKKPKSERK